MSLKKNRHPRIAAALLASTFLFCAVPVSANTIDYGSLELLFDEPITTSATGQPQRISEVPLDMEIITAEDIRRSGATDIPGVLGRTSSLNVWHWTRATADVSAHGYNQAFAPRLLVLINGRQIYSDAYGNTVWENVPVQLEEIRQIEIVKGPNSALFGFNAVSGVVNIITYNPIYDDVSSAGVRMGTGSYRQGHLVHTHNFGDRAGIRLSLGGVNADEFGRGESSSTVYESPSKHQFSMDGVLQVTPDSQFRFEASKTKAKSVEFPFVYNGAVGKYDTNSVKATYTANTDNGIVQANFYRNWQKLQGIGRVLYHYKNDVTVAQIENLFRAGKKHIFRFQGEYRRNALDGSLLSDGAEISYGVYAASAMWNWNIRSDLSWTNAVRIDHMRTRREGPLVPNAVLASNDDFEKKRSEISYNSGLVWNIDNRNTVRLTTARGVQTPSLMDLGTDFAANPFVIALGNPDIKSGIVTNYEIGYDRRIEDIDASLRTSVFYQRTQNLKGSNAVTTGFVGQTGNIGDSTLKGIDMSMEGRIGDNWIWDAGYAFLNVSDSLIYNQDGTISIAYNGENATPVHTGDIHLGYAKGPWEVDAFAKYVSDYEVLAGTGQATFAPVKVGDYITLSGRIGYKISDQVTVALSGQELNHSEVDETSGFEKERQVFLSLSASF